MGIVVGWSLFALGVAHLFFGLVRFRHPLAQAMAAGFVGQFAATEARRTAFWFLIFALPVMLAGQLAVRATGSGDLAALRLIGGYLLAPLLLAAGHGLV